VARLDVKRVGIWGTKATIKSGVFPAKLKESAPDAAVRAWATPLLVPVIEENILSGPILDAVIDGYAAPTEAEQVDALVLACTHYPIVASQIGQRMGRNVALLSTPQIVAEHVAAALGHRELLHSGAPKAPHEFMVSDYTPAFEAIAQQFFGEAISLREDHLWG
jgi:glutamate racemase